MCLTLPLGCTSAARPSTSAPALRRSAFHPKRRVRRARRSLRLGRVPPAKDDGNARAPQARHIAAETRSTHLRGNRPGGAYDGAAPCALRLVPAHTRRSGTDHGTRGRVSTPRLERTALREQRDRARDERSRREAHRACASAGRRSVRKRANGGASARAAGRAPIIARRPLFSSLVCLTLSCSGVRLSAMPSGSNFQPSPPFV